MRYIKMHRKLRVRNIKHTTKESDSKALMSKKRDAIIIIIKHLICTCANDMLISEILEKEGYRVARRTVAKYRGILGIGGTSERKKA